MIVFSDLHLREASEQACALVLDEICRLALADDMRVVFCGDFWHIRYQVSVRLQNMVFERLSAWALKGIEVDFVPGNHDQVDVPGRNALEVFEALEGVRVWTEPGVKDAAVRFGCVPYRRDPAVVREMLAAVATKVPRPVLIFAHLPVSGSLMNNGHQDQGDFVIPEGLPPLVLGHYHRAQAGPPHPTSPGWSTWQYVGSPYQTSFGEVGNVCGCWRIDAQLRPTFIPLDLGIPAHHILTWDPAESPDPPPWPGAPGDRVRLDVKASREMIVGGKFKGVLKKHGLDQAQVNVVPVAVPREHRFSLQTGESLVAAAGRFAAERLGAEPRDEAPLLEALGRWQ